MKTKLLSFLRSSNLYLFLLPIFFVLHGFNEYYNLIKTPKALELTTYYLIGTAGTLLISRVFLKNFTKASLFSFIIMSIYFFFGGFQDFVTDHFPESFITRYSFLLPAILIILLSSFVYFRKTTRSFDKLKLYLNTVILFLLAFDTVGVFIKINKRNKTVLSNEESLPICKECYKPDIYFILADGYSGNTALKEFFAFDNSFFENHLKEKGFFIPDSTFSNYNYTIYSMGSILNMEMLDIPGYFNGRRDIPLAFDAMRHNKLLGYLKKEGYEIHNYSIFDIDNHPPTLKSTLLDFEKSPLTTQTFLYRVKRDLGYHLFTFFSFLQATTQTRLVDLTNIQKTDSLTRVESKLKSLKPKFVYSHFVMPHLPYYYDSIGNRVPDQLLTDSFYADKNAYLSYLKYANKKLLPLVDEIYENTSGSAIIILLSDHGCRECLETDLQKGNAELLNVSAVYFPDKNYTGFYKGMSNVNLFRVVLNNQFNKKLPLLNDSLIILKEE